jgi:HK97 family phage portal protein
MFKLNFEWTGFKRSESKENQKRSIDSILTGEDILAPSRAGVSITPESSLTISAVYAAVRTYADTIASLPINLIQESNDSRTKQLDNPLNKLISKQPNMTMTRFTFTQLLVEKLLLLGNAFFYIDWDVMTMRPKELIFIPNELVKDVEVKRGVLQYTIILNDKERKLDQSNVLHFRGMGNELMGKSVIDYAKDNLGIGKAAENFGADFFNNGAAMSGIYEHDGELSDKAYNNLKSSIKNRLSEKHAVLLLEEGVKFRQTTIPPETAQFLQTREFSVVDVARWFKLPPQMLYDLTKSTYNNVEQQNLNFLIHSLTPYLVSIEQEYDRKLLQEAEKDDHFFKYNMNALLRGDIESRSKAYQLYINNGIMSINEVRKLEDLDPITGGDRLYMPINIAPIDEDGSNQINKEDGTD